MIPVSRLSLLCSLYLRLLCQPEEILDHFDAQLREENIKLDRQHILAIDF